MDSNYWLGRWARGETGWHQTEVEPRLIEHFGKLAPTRVLVPLCGKSLDLAWLASQGHEVIGVELSEEAVRAFFKDAGIAFEAKTEGPYLKFSAERITIYRGDFFALTPKILGSIGAIYDRAALIALPPELRIRYAKQLISLVQASADPKRVRFLQLLLEREPQDAEGPPFSIPEAELRGHYGEHFDIHRHTREAVDAKLFAPSQAFEVVYTLSWR